MDRRNSAFIFFSWAGYSISIQPNRKPMGLMQMRLLSQELFSRSEIVQAEKTPLFCSQRQKERGKKATLLPGQQRDTWLSPLASWMRNMNHHDFLTSFTAQVVWQKSLEIFQSTWGPPLPLALYCSVYVNISSFLSNKSTCLVQCRTR